MLSPTLHLDDATVGTTVALAAARVGGSTVLAPVALAPCTDAVRIEAPYTDARRVRHAHDGSVVHATSRTHAAKAMPATAMTEKQIQVRSGVPTVDATPWLMGTFRTYLPAWRLRLHAP